MGHAMCHTLLSSRAPNLKGSLGALSGALRDISPLNSFAMSLCPLRSRKSVTSSQLQDELSTVNIACGYHLPAEVLTFLLIEIHIDSNL